MNDNSPLRTLLRKDVQLILPLAATGLALTLLGNLFLFLIWKIYGGYSADTLYSGAISLWVAAPGLMAFGVAAMLIGTEEESGTLRWLRTLPISWHDFALSKFLSGASAYIVVWISASFCLYILSHAWTGRLPVRYDGGLTFNLFAIALFFQLLLLLLGYVVCYLIRMPVVALVVLIGVYTVLAIGVTAIFHDSNLFDRKDALYAVAAGIGLLTALAALQHFIALQRLRRADRTQGSAPRQMSEDIRSYRPPSIGMATKPTIPASLLWQQLRQTAAFSLGLVLVSVVMMVLFSTMLRGDQPSTSLIVTGGLAPLFIPLCASWLGAPTFYCDNENGRYAFFADRGVARWSVWWTRIVPTMIASIVLIVLLLGVAFMIDSSELQRIQGGALNLTITIAVLFSFGQLVSQWVDRPVLAFLAAPAYTLFSLIPFLYILSETGSGYPLIGLAVPVLLFATWHLSRLWMAGENKASYTVRAVAYTFVAVAIPCAILVGAAMVDRAMRAF